MPSSNKFNLHLAVEAANLVAYTLVSSLDNCNIFFKNMSGFNITSFQCIQNELARIVKNFILYFFIYFSLTLL